MAFTHDDFSVGLFRPSLTQRLRVVVDITYGRESRGNNRLIVLQREVTVQNFNVRSAHKQLLFLCDLDSATSANLRAVEVGGCCIDLLRRFYAALFYVNAVLLSYVRLSVCRIRNSSIYLGLFINKQ